MLTFLKKSKIANSRYNLKTVFYFIVLSLVLALGIGLRIHNLSSVTHRSPDEKTYTYQANVIASYGRQGTKFLVQQYAKHPILWFYPPPSRIGYLFLLSSTMKFFNNYSVSLGSSLSCFFSILTLLLLIVLGSRFFNKWTTLYALAFLSVSPIALAIARRTWQEALVGFIATMMLLCTCEIIDSPSKTIPLAGLVILGGIGLTIKTSLFIIFGLCGLFVLGTLLFKYKLYKQTAFFLTFSALATGIALSLMSYTLGNFHHLITIWIHNLSSMSKNSYAIQHQSGGLFKMLMSLWFMSPINLLLFLGSVLMVASSFEFYLKKKPIILFLLFFSLSLILITSLTPYCQNIRYINAIFIPFYLIAGMTLYSLMNHIPVNKWLLILLIAAILFFLTIDYLTFYSVFIKQHFLDTAIVIL